VEIGASRGHTPGMCARDRAAQLCTREIGDQLMGCRPGLGRRSALHQISTERHHGGSGLLAAFFALLSYPLPAIAIAADRKRHRCDFIRAPVSFAGSAFPQAVVRVPRQRREQIADNPARPSLDFDGDGHTG
jgi:hypothetical protein